MAKKSLKIRTKLTLATTLILQLIQDRPPKRIVEKPRTAGLCGRTGGACDVGPLSCTEIEPGILPETAPQTGLKNARHWPSKRCCVQMLLRGQTWHTGQTAASRWWLQKGHIFVALRLVYIFPPQILRRFPRSFEGGSGHLPGRMRLAGRRACLFYKKSFCRLQQPLCQ